MHMLYAFCFMRNLKLKEKKLVISLRSYHKSVLTSELGPRFPICDLIFSPPAFLLRATYTLSSVIQNYTLLNGIDKPLTCT